MEILAIRNGTIGTSEGNMTMLQCGKSHIHWLAIKDD